jgi:hypothetical protein
LIFFCSCIHFQSHVIFFPAKVLGPWDTCNVKGIAAYLNGHYAARTNLIVMEDESARFLYHTKLHIDFLANYPSQDKFVANQAFFQSQDESIAATIASRHHIDLVAVCPYLPVAAEDVQSRPQRAPMVMESLVEGHAPHWLKAVPIVWSGGYLLFEVDKTKLPLERLGH